MALELFDTLGMEKFVAAEPARPRDSSKLLVLDSKTGQIQHRVFRDIKEYLKHGDCLVINDSKVFPAKLAGKKKTGGKFEILLVRPFEGENRWLGLSRECKPGLEIDLPGSVTATAETMAADGEWIFRFSVDDVFTYAEKHGQMPLPHYIEKARKTTGQKTDFSDSADYQTVYAHNAGSIAAPTAGFHFTPKLIEEIKKAGVNIAHITLHVGWGTFRPVKESNPLNHNMLAEHARISEETAAKINKTLDSGGRVIPVGTTSTRTVESFCTEKGRIEPGSKWTGLFIYPPYKFKIAGALVTNFHLPGSTPLFLAAAFAGEKNLFSAYSSAVNEKYRFYSFGDAMLIL